jgi:hypothetical protein
MRNALSLILIAAATVAASAQTVTVRGTAFDSLHNAALPGAFVTMSGGGKNRSATADSSGHFVFDNVALGAYRVSMQHAAIDSLGFPGISTRATVTDGKQEILIALPSFPTMWRSVCGGTTAPADSGFLFGSVRDATTGKAVAQAYVDVSWIDVALDAQKKVTQKRWRRTARTDSTGSFGVCGVPASVALQVKATFDMSASGTIELPPSDARVQRRDLSLGPTTGTARGSVSGFLRGPAGFPFRDARITLEDLPEVRSDTGGRFIIRNAPLGTRQIEIMAIGMMPIFLPVDVVPNDTAFVDATLRRVVATLDPVKVKAAARLAAFNRDLDSRKKSGFGYMMDSTKIAPVGTLASVFAAAPSATLVRGKTNNDFTVWFPGELNKCLAIVWLDGRRSDFDEIKNIDPRDLALVEVYPHRLNIPREFMIGGLRNLCGVIALWRKTAVVP